MSQKEILALAISLEEEDERIYSDYGESLREHFPGTGQVFEEMRQEEIGHRRRLIELNQQKFGEHIPLTAVPVSHQNEIQIARRRKKMPTKTSAGSSWSGPRR